MLGVIEGIVCSLADSSQIKGLIIIWGDTTEGDKNHTLFGFYSII